MIIDIFWYPDSFNYFNQSNSPLSFYFFIMASFLLCPEIGTIASPVVLQQKGCGFESQMVAFCIEFVCFSPCMYK